MFCRQRQRIVQRYTTHVHNCCLIIKPFVYWRSRCGLLKAPNKRDARPLLYDWCFLTCTKLEIILFSFHYRVIRQQLQIYTICHFHFGLVSDSSLINCFNRLLFGFNSIVQLDKQPSSFAVFCCISEIDNLKVLHSCYKIFLISCTFKRIFNSTDKIIKS